MHFLLRMTVTTRSAATTSWCLGPGACMFSGGSLATMRGMTLRTRARQVPTSMPSILSCCKQRQGVNQEMPFDLSVAAEMCPPMGFGGFVSLCSITYNIEAASAPASLPSCKHENIQLERHAMLYLRPPKHVYWHRKFFLILFCMSGMPLKQSVNGHHQGKALCVHGGCNTNLQLDTSQVVAVAC